MPLQGSGEIKFSEIAAEFGDSAPHSMSEFYRNGSLVPSTKTVATTGTNIGPMSGTNAPKYQASVNNNLQVYEANESTKSPGSVTGAYAPQRTGLTYTTPYAGTMYCLVVGGGAAGSWWGGGIGAAGGGGGARLVSKSVGSGESYSVTVGGGGTGHGPGGGHGQGGSQSIVTGPGSFSVNGNGAGHVSPYSGGGGGGNGSSGTGITVIGSSNGGTGQTGNGRTGGASGITSITGLTVSPINGTDTQIWAQSTRNSPLNSATNRWHPGSYSAGSWTFSNTIHMGGWGQGGVGLHGDYNGGHGAGGLVVMWMNQLSQSNINTNVTTSGQNKFSNFYSAEDA